MKEFDLISFYDMPIGHFCTDMVHIWESVRSGDVYAESFAPDHPMMKCVHVLDEEKAQFKVGEITEDYFNNKFIYMCDNNGFDRAFKLVKLVKQKVDDARNK